MATQIHLPATAIYNLERERMATRHHALQDFQRHVRELDVHSDLVKAHENAAAPGMTPGFWHIRRTDPLTGWDQYIALKGPDGQFSEPHSGHLEMLRAADLQRAGGFEELMKRVDREEEESRKLAAFKRGEYKTEFLERYLNKERPSVSFADVRNGWRNKAEARRG